jgi:hypothetical protein
MTSAISTIPVIIPNLVSLRYGSGKLSYPVKPDQIIVAQFRHINTYPSDDGVSSASVFKLRILDNLIEQLGGETGRAEDFLRISKDNVDSLITKLKGEAALRNVYRSSSYGNLQPATGIILDTFA